jgi:hypothetical protein
MKTEKMNNSMRVRIHSDLQDRFAAVLKSEGKGRSQSETLRELMEAAIRYFERNGDLYPPFELMPGKRGGELSDHGATVVSPVINGHGNHVRTHVRSRRK